MRYYHIVAMPQCPITKLCKHKGGNPGLVVMGDKSCSKGREFESQYRFLDEHDIFHIDLL